MKPTFIAFVVSLLTPFTSTASASYCLSQSAANMLVERYGSIIVQQDSDLGSPVVTARAIAAPGYTETSDSANIILGIPLGSVTTPSKQAFITSSQNNPPVEYKTLGVFVACNYVTWQWVSVDFGSGAYEVKEFHLFKVASDGLLQETFFEFNSIAGALDTGHRLVPPNGTIIP